MESYIRQFLYHYNQLEITCDIPFRVWGIHVSLLLVIVITIRYSLFSIRYLLFTVCYLIILLRPVSGFDPFWEWVKNCWPISGSWNGLAHFELQKMWWSTENFFITITHANKYVYNKHFSITKRRIAHILSLTPGFFIFWVIVIEFSVSPIAIYW
jgi:hypothetical protein